MKCTVCGEEKNIVEFVSIYSPLQCKKCRPESTDQPGRIIEEDSPDDVTFIDPTYPTLSCPECGRRVFPSEEYCANCEAPLPVVVRVGGVTGNIKISESPPSDDDLAPQEETTPTPNTGSSKSTGKRISDKQDAHQIKKIFRRFLWGWTVFFVLAWFLNHDLKFLLEVFVSVLMAAAAALVSTLIYWGIREFRKPGSDTVRRAESAEHEVVELRKQVEELSKKSDK